MHRKNYVYVYVTYTYTYFFPRFFAVLHHTRILVFYESTPAN